MAMSYKASTVYPAVRTGAISLPEKVMGLTGALMLLAVGGAGIGWHGANSGTGIGGSFWMWLIAEFALLFATMFLADSIWGYLTMGGFGVCTGITTAPLLASIVASGQGGVIVQAVAATGLITLGTAGYANRSSRDFSGMGPYLFAGLIKTTPAHTPGFNHGVSR